MKRTLLCILTITAFSYGAKAQTYVNINATGANNGSSWTDAFTDLHDATFNIPSGEIWVAQGTYTPTNKNAAIFIETIMNQRTKSVFLSFVTSILAAYTATRRAPPINEVPEMYPPIIKSSRFTQFFFDAIFLFIIQVTA